MPLTTQCRCCYLPATLYIVCIKLLCFYQTFLCVYTAPRVVATTRRGMKYITGNTGTVSHFFFHILLNNLTMKGVSLLIIFVLFTILLFGEGTHLGHGVEKRSPCGFFYWSKPTDPCYVVSLKYCIKL